MPLVRSSHPWLPTALAPSGSCSLLRSPATSATRSQTNRTPSPARSASSPCDGPVPPRYGGTYMGAGELAVVACRPLSGLALPVGKRGACPLAEGKAILHGIQDFVAGQAVI